jgi:hypothetical protein
VLFCAFLLLAVVNEQRFNVAILSQDGQVHRLNGMFRIHPEWHPQDRRDRFPSAEERVKVYMSNWYTPPCPGERLQYTYQLLHDDDGWPNLNVSRPLNPAHSEIFDSIVVPDQWFLLDTRTIKNCARQQWKQVLRGNPVSTRVMKRRNMRPYCSDVIDLLDIAKQLESSTPVPLLAYFGDGSGIGISLPFFAKYRSATSTKTSLQQVTGECDTTSRAPLHTFQHADKLKPIIWKLESSRHLHPLTIARKMDTPWERKLNRAFWAGDMTGPFSGKSDLEKCRSNQRCQFVLDHARSSLIDCGLTSHRLGSDVIHGTNIQRKRESMSFIQKYKVLVSLEGNDVASGLKWSLQSESVVLMPPPTQTSWAMEELLEPWVHYIPMFPNGSNAEKMVQWALNHDQEARKIAERATLFIYDLLYHSDAMTNERQVKQEIVRRYRAFW